MYHGEGVPRIMSSIFQNHTLIRASMFATIFLVWYLISLFFPPSFLPGPSIVMKEVYKIFMDGSFLFHMYHTLVRVFVGFVWAFLVSLGLGIAMGVNRLAEKYFEEAILVGLTIPGLAWAIISLLWFGISDLAAWFAIFIIITPIITINIWEGTKSLDKDLIEMGQAFKATRAEIISNIILPQLVPYLFAAIRFGFALSWKVVVLSEMLGLSNGVGFMINYAFELFSMKLVLAWTVGFAVVMLIIEMGIVNLIEDRLTRWRPEIRLVAAGGA